MDQLESMKARLVAGEEDKRVQEEIQRKLLEKEERKRHVEKLRKERTKKLEEDAAKLLAAQRRNEEVCNYNIPIPIHICRVKYLRSSHNFYPFVIA